MIVRQLGLSIFTDCHDDIAGFREFDRIVDEIAQNLTNAHRIGINKLFAARNITNGKFQCLIACLGGIEHADIIDDFQHVDSNRVQFQLVRFNLREIENILNNPHQNFAGIKDGSGQALLFRGEGSVQHQFRHTDDTTHGGPNFMAHRRKEFRFEPIGFLCLANGVFQFLCAFAHHLFEILPVIGEFHFVAFAQGDVFQKTDQILRLSLFIINGNFFGVTEHFLGGCSHHFAWNINYLAGC